MRRQVFMYTLWPVLMTWLLRPSSRINSELAELSGKNNSK